QPNPDQYIGINSTLTPGVNGQSQFIVLIDSTNGVQTSRTDISSAVLVAPVTEVRSIGAKDFPANVNALNWQALARCESTNNPKAINLTNHNYFGLYQFSLATWASVGGSGNPTDATADEQSARAKMLYMRSGAGQWECGSHLSD
ncbi:MAG: resuscitation-promoting factor, partial [Antricoccus sp.]